MKIKRYFAADMRQAIRMVREQQGPDAVILSNRRVDGGVEIVAAIDYDEAAIETMGRSEPAVRAPAAPPAPESHANPFEAVQGTAPAADSAPPAAPSEPAAQPKVVWSQDPALVAMREEIHSLRGIIETQLSGLAWRGEVQSHPYRARVLEQLMRLGLSPEVCRQLGEQVPFSNDPEHNWRQALGHLARSLPVTGDDILEQGGVVALLGATGVGKTTTAAKLAARYALRHGSKRVALVTTDSYRIGAHQQLRTYGRLLDIPVHVAADAAELGQVLHLLRDKDLVLIDTAGMSQHDMRLSEQLSQLHDGAPQVRPYLVLSAATQSTAQEEVVRAFSHLQLSGCILTKVDETSRLGESLSVVVRQQLPVAYVSDGQRVPEDLHPARANKLVSRSVAQLPRGAEQPGEEAMASAFGKMVSNAHA